MVFNDCYHTYMAKMKLQKMTLLFLVIGLLGCSKENNEITINGEISGFISEKVEFTTPINGKWFYGDKKSITPDSAGTFQIKMSIDEPSFVTIYVPGKAGGVLLVEPSKIYKVNFNLGVSGRKFIVNSGDSIAQNLYNSYPSPEFYISGIKDFLADSIPSEITKKIYLQKGKVISEFDKLLESNEISKSFHELAILDRKCYYLALEASVAGVLLRKHITDVNISKIKLLKDYWTKKINESLLNQTDYVRSPWFYTLATNLINFNLYRADDFSLEELKKVYEAGNFHNHDIKNAKKYLSGKELEYYLASYIYLYSWQNKDNSKQLIESYKNFKSEYPNSKYTQFLTTSIQPIIDFHKKIAESPISDKIKFVENYEGVDTFQDLIKTLKDKKVYVDIWGTWCSPCKKEFQQKDKLAELLKSKNITTLYICEGINSKKNVWKEMIKFYDLEGQHILANDKLVADIIDRFGNNGSFAYPRYLLVNENGIVVNEQASYPSKIVQLENEINRNYVW